MVTKDTVDHDIYEMQQRKSEMNAAIMGRDGGWNAKTAAKEKQNVPPIESIAANIVRAAVGSGDGNAVTTVQFSL